MMVVYLVGVVFVVVAAVLVLQGIDVPDWVVAFIFGVFGVKQITSAASEVVKMRNGKNGSS